MSGPVKAALLIALAVIVMGAVNVVMWRRLRAALAEGRARAAAEAEGPAGDPPPAS
jgi:hypothetical protein